mmetsp:Transcript_80781/g.160512  ORF Transcript_80781/g.160512 Transcript_80781/m.160512 type:complete len:891 (-) Transcript_80781:425-3097(-)
MTPTALPPPAPGKSFSLIKNNSVQVEVPDGAIPGNKDYIHKTDQAKIAVHTLSVHAVAHLKDDPKFHHGEFCFSPIVRIDYPAFASNDEVPEVGANRLPPFAKPLTLVMPHCFSNRSVQEGEESVVMLGAPHGAKNWEHIHVVTTTQDTEVDSCVLEGQMMRVQVPYAGHFCAFSDPDREDIAMARFHVFCLPELPRDDASALRVHLCPELPGMIDEMVLSENSEWGLTLDAGQSKLLCLPEGAKFRVSFGDEEKIMTWQGTRCHEVFTLPAMGQDGELPADDDPDRREKFQGALTIDILEGKGTRARLVNALAKRAEIPVAGYKVPFETRLDPECRPGKPRNVTLKERTQYDFTITWQAPKLIDADGDGDYSEITHYAIEIATTAPSGTYLPWRLLWQGEGHEPPDFQKLLGGKDYDEAKAGDMISAVTRRKLEEDEELARQEEEAKASAKRLAEFVEKERAAYVQLCELAGEEPEPPPAMLLESPTECASVYANKKQKSKGVKAKGKDKRKGKKEKETPTTYSYTLEVSPELFGKLRVRCWCEDDNVVSRASDSVKLQRFKGEPLQRKPPKRVQLEELRRRYYKALAAPMEPAGVRAGPQTSKNEHGYDGIPRPPLTLADLDPKAKSIQMALVPYDVPQLDSTLPGYMGASCELAAFYKEMGVYGGGGGTFCGLTIDQVLHAVMGTPLNTTVVGKNGHKYRVSPRRTIASLFEPLIAFCEVFYADVLLPLVRDSVVVMKTECMFIDEKVAGIIAQIAIDRHRRNYALCTPHLKEIIMVLHELYETIHQCTSEQIIALHLENINYSKPLKKKLKEELTHHLAASLWRLSTELLEMQLDIKAEQKGTIDQVARLQLMSWATTRREKGGRDKKGSGFASKIYGGLIKILLG